MIWIWFCCRCMSYEKAEKQLTVIEAPNVLTIVLKRFRVIHFYLAQDKI